MKLVDKASVVAQSFRIRHIEYEDLEIVNKVTELEYYDVGLANLKTYYNCSNTIPWICVENELGEIIAIDIGNLLPNGIIYGFVLVVKPEYRGKGISSLTISQWNSYPQISSSSLKSVQIFPDIMECWKGKMLTMFGMVQPSAARVYASTHRQFDVQVERITEKNLAQIFAYDERLIKLDRKRFLNEWCCNEDSQAFCSMQNGTCTGFGVLKKFSGCYCISPLYANDDNAAIAIFAKLAEHLDQQYLYVPAQSHQRVTLDFCQGLNLSFMNSEIRNCTVSALEYFKSIDMTKVYTTHDYWPV